MYKITAALALLLLLFCFSMPVLAESDIDQHRECKHCGMDRKAYGYSRMLVKYKDGREVGTCSLHCTVTELEQKSGEVVSIKVADRDSRKLIDAQKAYWVIGGSKRGVMSPVAKWAFENKEIAEGFIKKYGGRIVSWSEALSTAEKEFPPRTK